MSNLASWPQSACQIAIGDPDRSLRFPSAPSPRATFSPSYSDFTCWCPVHLSHVFGWALWWRCLVWPSCVLLNCREAVKCRCVVVSWPSMLRCLCCVPHAPPTRRAVPASRLPRRPVLPSLPPTQISRAGAPRTSRMYLVGRLGGVVSSGPREAVMPRVCVVPVPCA